MSLRFYNFQGERVDQYDTEDKSVWCDYGSTLEKTFVRLYGDLLKLSINPAKANDAYAPDLLYNGKHLADLKTQNTPFFSALRYGMNRQYTVSFNVTDMERYLEKYPDILVFFWVFWDIQTMETNDCKYSVAPMVGVWGARLEKLNVLCQEKAAIHSYTRRQDDGRNNAPESYLIDIRWLDRLV